MFMCSAYAWSKSLPFFALSVSSICLCSASSCLGALTPLFAASDSSSLFALPWSLHHALREFADRRVLRLARRDLAGLHFGHSVQRRFLHEDAGRRRSTLGVRCHGRTRCGTKYEEKKDRETFMGVPSNGDRQSVAGSGRHCPRDIARCQRTTKRIAWVLTAPSGIAPRGSASVDCMKHWDVVIAGAGPAGFRRH